MNKLVFFTSWSFLLAAALTAQDSSDQLGSRVFTSEDVSLSVSAFLQGRYTLTEAGNGPRAQTFGVPLRRIAPSGNVTGHGASYSCNSKDANFTIDSGFRINRWTTQAAVYARKAGPNGAIAARLDRGAYAQIGFLIVPGKSGLGARHAIVGFDNRPGANLSADIREYTGGVNRYILGHKLKQQFDAGMLDQRTFAGTSTKGFRVRAQAQILF